MGLVCPRMLLRLIVRFQILSPKSATLILNVPADAATSVYVCSSKIIIRQFYALWWGWLGAWTTVYTWVHLAVTWCTYWTHQYPCQLATNFISVSIFHSPKTNSADLFTFNCFPRSSVIQILSWWFFHLNWWQRHRFGELKKILKDYVEPERDLELHEAPRMWSRSIWSMQIVYSRQIYLNLIQSIWNW